MADNDLLSIEEARRAGPGEGIEEHDADLKVIVTGISTRIDQLCGPVVIRTISDEQHSHDIAGETKLFLATTPIDDVTSVSEWSHGTETQLSAETLADLPAEAYRLDHVGRHLWWLERRRSGTTQRWSGTAVVTYTAGRYENTAGVAEHFKLAAQSIIRRLWKRESQAWAQSPDYFPSIEDPQGQQRFAGFFRAVDPVVKEFLGDERKIAKPPAVGG